MEELKPCPFCGNKKPKLNEAMLACKPAWMVECMKCYASVRAEFTKGKAIQAWNQRVPK
jgi:Lar family restriction alleviation protein